MPIKMGGTVRSVVVGDSVYIGGGDADNLDDSCTVMKLDLQQDEWTKLPQYSARFFAMTSLANQLVLVGGLDRVTHKPTNQIALYTPRSWISPYPPMNTARSFTTAVCYNNHIIVAGGFDGREFITSSVELLNVEERRWYNTVPLPNPRKQQKSTVIGNTLYLMGGLDHTGSTKVVHMVDLNELITTAASEETTPTLWQVISDTPLRHSAPLSVESSLLAVGGLDDHVNLSSSIHLYQPFIGRWVKVGDLPTVRQHCTCSVLPSGDVIVAGGLASDYGYINTIYFLTISNA